MTITYSLDVSGAKAFAFTKLLFRWRGSIYKLIKMELLIFASLYYVTLAIHRWGLTAGQREKFTDICLYFRNYLDYVPITFVLGFYVSLVVTRWWNIYLSLPWIDRMGVIVGAYVHGKDVRGRIIRRSLVRYVNLMSVLSLRCVSLPVKRRFPTLQHIVDGKLMTESEKAAIESSNRIYGEYFMPALWFGNLVAQARREGRITDDIHVRHLMSDLNEIRSWVGMMVSYDWISIPLVYTQVVVIATYTFFIGCIFGRQYLDREDGTYWISKFFPMFTFFQFFFYMGWLKVAEVLINPLGDDDDDFEVNYLIDRNVCIGFLMVDDLYSKYPLLERDPYWDDQDPLVPYTQAAANTYIEPYLGSAVGVGVPEGAQDWVTCEQKKDEDLEDESGMMSKMRKFSRKVSQMTQPGGLAADRVRHRHPRRRSISAAARVGVSRQISHVTSQSDSMSISSATNSQSYPFSDDTKVGPFDIDSLGVSDHGGKKVSLGAWSQESASTPSEHRAAGAAADGTADTLEVLEEVDEDSDGQSKVTKEKSIIDDESRKADIG